MLYDISQDKNLVTSVFKMIQSVPLFLPSVLRDDSRARKLLYTRHGLLGAQVKNAMRPNLD